MKYFLIIVSFVVLLFVITFAAFSAKRPGRPNLTVTFLQFTNDLEGTRLAAFTVANSSSWDVERLLTYRVQAGRGDLWTNYDNGWFAMKTSSLLPAGGSEIIMVPAATNQNRWRVGFNVRNQDGPIFSKASKLVQQAQSLGLPTTHRNHSYAFWSNPVEE